MYKGLCLAAIRIRIIRYLKDQNMIYLNNKEVQGEVVINPRP